MYQTIEKNTSFELVEKKSKFIANLVYVENKQDAERRIKEFKKKYHDARHNCYAFRVFEQENIYEKSSDDGEPSGTAGSPILSILQKNNMCNVLVVVTRYFGGILLGTGGLVRCYSGATLGAIEQSCKVYIEPGAEFEVQIEYQDFQEMQYYFQKNDIKILNIKYEELISCNIEMTNFIKSKFLEDVEKNNIKIKCVKYLKDRYVRVDK